MKAKAEYRLPRRYLPGFVWSVLALRPRSFAHDAARLMCGAHPPPLVLGGENIPAHGPCLVVCNHYTRPGLPSWWLTLLIQAAVAARRAPDAERDVHWVMAAAWTYPPGSWQDRLKTPVTAWAFRRVAAVYGFVSMPPMPPRPHELEARAAAVLHTVRLARRLARCGGMIGLAPQGADVADPLQPPPAGAGDFVALLFAAGLPLLPVGVSEPAARLCLSFGPLFRLDLPAGRAGRDAAASAQVMAAIGRRLSPAVHEPAESSAQS